MIVVLDTNIWISGLLFRGKPADAIAKAVANGRVAVCRQLVEEIEEVATRKFSQKIAEVKADLAELLIRALWVEVTGQIKACRDPDDDIILECAKNAKARLIVTGDADLLSMREFQGIRIVNASQFLTSPAVA